MSTITADTILGWATIILDMFGIRQYISVYLFVGAAAYIFARFIRSRD
jgi:hypothetical protein